MNRLNDLRKQSDKSRTGTFYESIGPHLYKKSESHTHTELLIRRNKRNIPTKCHAQTLVL